MKNQKREIVLPTHNIGDTVKVFLNPINFTIPEGEAVLLKYFSTLGQLEYWKVRFIKDGFITSRYIKIKKINILKKLLNIYEIELTRSLNEQELAKTDVESTPTESETEVNFLLERIEKKLITTQKRIEDLREFVSEIKVYM